MCVVENYRINDHTMNILEPPLNTEDFAKP